MSLELAHLHGVLPLKVFRLNLVQFHHLLEGDDVTSLHLEVGKALEGVMMLLKLGCHVESSLSNENHVASNLLSVFVDVCISNANS